MTGFGASAPYKELYKQFGITAEAVAEAAMASSASNDGIVHTRLGLASRNARDAGMRRHNDDRE